MASYEQQFNTLMLDFLAQLAEVFPDRPELATCSKRAKALVETRPQMPTQIFASTVLPHAIQVSYKDPVFFENCLKILNIDVRALWHSDISDESREVIWTYLQQMSKLATEASLPADFLSRLMGIAEEVKEGKIDLGRVFRALGQELPPAKS